MVHPRRLIGEDHRPGIEPINDTGSAEDIAGEQSAADAERDVRDFALKFYAEKGNWDLVGRVGISNCGGAVALVPLVASDQ